MKVDFTPEEAQFLIENLGQLSVPLSNPNAPQIVVVGNAVMRKLNDAILAERESPEAKAASK